MAAIIKDEQQLLALNEINAGLDLVKQINAATDTGAHAQLIISPEKGKGIKFDVPDEELKPLLSLLGRIKAKQAKTILTKAKKSRISLDEDDLAVLRHKTESTETPEEE